MIKGLPYLGLVTSFLVLVGAFGAVISMCYIWYTTEVLVKTPRVAILMGWACCLGIPLTFVIAWIFVIAHVPLPPG